MVFATASAASALSLPSPAPAEAVARDGEAAFRQLFNEYAQRVYNLVLRSVGNPEEAEDLCQEIWVKAYRQISALRDHRAFPAWLYRIASRCCVDAARHRGRRAEAVVVPEWLPTNQQSPEEAASEREEVALLWEALGVLPPRQQLALFLREVEGYSYARIGETLETTESAVETLLFRARRALSATYRQLEKAPPERCDHAREAMRTLLDGEGGPLRRRALRAHLDGCQPCRLEFHQLRRSAAAYAALALLPLPAALEARVFATVGGAGAAPVSAGIGGGGAWAVKAVQLAAMKVKLLGGVLATTAAVAAGSALNPGPAPAELSPAALHAESRVGMESPTLPGPDAAGGGGEVETLLLEELTTRHAAAEPASAGRFEAETLLESLQLTVNGNDLTELIGAALEPTGTVVEGVAGTLEDLVTNGTAAGQALLEPAGEGVGDALGDLAGVSLPPQEDLPGLTGGLADLAGTTAPLPTLTDGAGGSLLP